MLRLRFRRSSPRLLLAVGSVFLLFAFLIGFSSNSSRAETAPPGTERWISFTGEPATSPQMTVLASSGEYIDLKAEFSGVTAEEIKLDDGTIFTRFSGEGYGTSILQGYPALPVLRQQVEIPTGAQIQVEVISASYKDYSLEELGLYPPYPRQPSVVKMPGAEETQAFVIDQEYYDSGLLYPASPAASGEPYVMRGRTIALVEAWPMAYDPASQSLRIYTDLTFRLKLNGGDVEASQALSERYATRSFDGVFQDLVLNYNLGQPVDEAALDEPGAYIIITADDFADEIQPFVTLQQNYGFDVHVKLMSEFPGGLAAMKAYIQDAYDTWPVPPDHVLLVGDTNTVPTYVGVTDVPATDLYFVTMDGADDWHPDMGRGRFPARTGAQVTYMVDKYLAYALVTGEEDWVNKISFPATCDNYTVAEGSHNYVIDTFTAPKGYQGIFPVNPTLGGDKLYCVTHNADQADVIAAYNDARKMVIYSGHGSFDGWELLDQSAIPASLHAEGVFPFVASHACMTGDYTQTEVFGETWVLQQNKGAIAFWGASTYTYWDEDDVLEKAVFDTYFSEPEGNADLWTMTNAGLLAVEAFGTDLDRYYFEEYNIMGDPSLYVFLTPRTPTFGVSPAQTDIEICRPDSVSMDVEVTSLQNYSATVTLSATGLPAGVTVSFDPAAAQAPFTSSFLMDIGPTAPAGEHDFSFHGEGSDLQTKDTPAALTIYDGLPAEAELLFPADGSSGVSLAPVFDWADDSSVGTWNFQLTDDPFFIDPMEYQQGLTESSTVLDGALGSEGCYWWRVSGDNTCGAGDWSEPFLFQTQALAFFDNMENGTSLWTGGGASNQWALSTSQAHSPTHSYFTPNAGTTSDTWIYNAAPVSPVDGSILSFWHMYAFEGSSYDGAVLEISTDGGTTWDDAGDHILTNGYNGTVSTCCGNPLGGRQGWVGDLGEWTEVTVDLSAFAGQPVTFRWRMGTDSSITDTGWFIDDVTVTGAAAVSEPPVLETVTPNSGSNTVPTNITITGQHFTGTVFLRLGDVYLTEVTLVNDTTIEAVIPAGLPVGQYTLYIINGNCLQDQLELAFTVTGGTVEDYFIYLPVVRR